MNKTKKYIGAIAMGAVLLTAPGCSDSWDDHYGLNEENSSAADQTLWQHIQGNPNLSRFASILQATNYYKDEEHPLNDPQSGKAFTFDQLLDGTQLLTVWAPENDAFTEDSYNQWMGLAKTNPYNVQQQLIGNSIALWRNPVSTGRADSLRMLNGKIMLFDQANQTMSGLAMNNINIAATNGTLHTTREVIPFNYNLYEYLKDQLNAEVNHLNSFHDFIVLTDTSYFDEESSQEGAPDINGFPTYVDSVSVTSNTMFYTTHLRSASNPEKDWFAKESFGANIICEDSNFVMLIPTDAAWEKAYQKLSPLYKYAPVYLHNDKFDGGTVERREADSLFVDSMTQTNILMDIVSPLCFNINLQPNAIGRKGTWTADQFIQEKGASAKYLLNTFGDTLRSDANWNKSSLFEGKPIKMSNGYGIVTDEWNIPTKLYQPDVIVEVKNNTIYRYSQNSSTHADGSPAYVPVPDTYQWVAETGKVSHNNFYHVIPSAATSNATTLEIALRGTEGENHESDVLSGKYDIQIVLVPNYYYTSNDSTINLLVGNNGSGKLVDGEVIPVKHKLKATLSYNNGTLDSKGKSGELVSGTIDYDGTKVDTITVFQDFEFPYSYKNLIYSYPTLKLVTDTKSDDRNKKGYSNDYCIDQVILVSKGDDSAAATKEE